MFLILLGGNVPKLKTSLNERAMRKKEKEDTWIAPQGLNQEAWQEYEQHRKQLNSSMSNMAKTKAANQIKNLPSDDQQMVIDLSISNGLAAW